MFARLSAASAAALLAAAPAHALTSFATTTYFAGFETDLDGWQDFNGSGVSRTAGGYEGAWHGVATGGATSFNGPYSTMGGYSSVWTGDWAVQTAIYLDPAWTTGAGFEYSVAASGSDGDHQRDFVFSVARDVGALRVNASNNSTGNGNGAPTNLAGQTEPPSESITAAGWYVFEHVFRDVAGLLAVEMNVYASGDLSTAVFTETRGPHPDDQIPLAVGGNRYAWFATVDLPGGVAFDSVRMTESFSAVPVPAALPLLAGGVGLLGLLRLRRRT
ncbi:MAG: hypothetical protein ACU0DT_15895 [Albimonas sp.]|uniref:hypothetical protein n=1 Tax=Albimonas sp. TaxID=1872425 RepID=UPI00405608C4